MERISGEAEIVGIRGGSEGIRAVADRPCCHESRQVARGLRNLLKETDSGSGAGECCDRHLVGWHRGGGL